IKVEWHHGLKGGYELPMAMAAMAFTLIFFGAGPMALDAIRGGGGGRSVKSKLRQPSTSRLALSETYSEAPKRMRGQRGLKNFPPARTLSSMPGRASRATTRK